MANDRPPEARAVAARTHPAPVIGAAVHPQVGSATLAPPAAPVILELMAIPAGPISNPMPDMTSPTWAKDLAGGETFMSFSGPRWEWIPVLDPTNEYDDTAVGLSGTAINPNLSGKDNPFLHPFGFDFEFYIAPDAPYRSLVAAPTKPPDSEYARALGHASQDLGLPVPSGLLGVETDRGLVPDEYRPHDGDRVAVYGRWIVDSGHDDFHTEVHPPLLLAHARPFADVHSSGGKADATMSKVIARPYLVSQDFGDGGMFEHLIKEVAKVDAPVFPQSTRIEAHPRILPKAFAGVHLISYVVRPPTPRPRLTDTLVTSFHFTARPGCAVQVYAAGSDGVGVLIAMNDAAMTRGNLPKRHDWSLSVDDLGRLNPDVKDIYEGIIFASLLTPQFIPGVASAILARGILTDTYDPPVAVSPLDAQNVVFNHPVANLSPGMGVSHDENQPFPIYGWLNVGWDSHFDLAVSLAGVRFHG